MGTNFPPLEVLEIGNPGMPGQLIIHNGQLFVYGPSGVTLIDGGVIQTEAILANSITADKLTIGSQLFTHELEWTAVDEDTVEWSAGDLKLASGTVYTIDAGNTGNIGATTYIYFDGTATLKTTTDFSVAISDTKLLLAIVEIADTGGKAVITPIASTGTTITGDRITTGRIQSTDTQTYFDLNDGRMIVNNGDEDSILIGKKST